MDINDVILAAPDAIAELTREFVRRGDEEYKKDEKSQVTACFLLAIRSASLLFGIARLIPPATHDSTEVLLRAFLEARDLCSSLSDSTTKAREPRSLIGL
jgi:hypothetical protein